MVAKPTTPYTFPVSPHTLWIISQLIELPRINSIDAGEEFYVQSFSQNYLPSIEYDYYAHQVLQYLKFETIIDIHYGDGKGLVEYTLPLKDKPKHTMVSEWLVSIQDKASLNLFYKKIAYRFQSLQASRLDFFNCRFSVSDDAIFWLESEKGKYPLRSLYEGLVAHKVLSTLCEFGVVTLDEENKIKEPGKYAGTVVKSLHDTLRGVGFDKYLKDQILLESTRNRIAIKLPSTVLPQQIHNFLIEHFEEAMKLKSANVQKRKSLRPDSIELLRKRES